MGSGIMARQYNGPFSMYGVFLDRATVDSGDLDFSPLLGVLPSWRFHATTLPEDLDARIAGADVVVCNKVGFDAAALAGAGTVRLICLTATGTNNIDLAAARARGILVCNVVGYATAAVVQHVFAFILTFYTRLSEYHAAVRAGRWQDSPRFCLLDYEIREVAGKTLAVVGYGELGRAVARVAEAFGMQVLVAERKGMAARLGRVTFEQALTAADVLSIHCPLTPATCGMIGFAEFAGMKRGAILINTARGGIVDEDALIAALRSGHLGGAGIDVLAQEPPPNPYPLLAADIPNLIVTPHTAWASHEARQRVIHDVAETIHAFLMGTPRNVVSV